jgi:uncharacterized membrane protein (UPF0127 family)
VRSLFACALLVAAACQDGPGSADGEGDFTLFPPGAKATELAKVVQKGLQTPGHGTIYFAVLRDGERHSTAFRAGSFHAVIGSGLARPEGTLMVRNNWACSGQVDGANEEPEKYGVSIAVEPGAARPYSDAIRSAAAAFVEALAAEVPLHPDCVLAMEEIPYTNRHVADPFERELAEAARSRVPVPKPNGLVTIQSGDRVITVGVERRTTGDGIAVGMMFRKAFDGESRGMTFEYPAADYRHFWMRNCPIPIDVAYVNRGRIEEIHTMEPAFGKSTRDPRYYDSSAVANVALEMPARWFERNGVKPGDTVTIAPAKPQ